MAKIDVDIVGEHARGAVDGQRHAGGGGVRIRNGERLPEVLLQIGSDGEARRGLYPRPVIGDGAGWIGLKVGLGRRTIINTPVVSGAVTRLVGPGGPAHVARIKLSDRVLPRGPGAVALKLADEIRHIPRLVVREVARLLVDLSLYA